MFDEVGEGGAPPAAAVGGEWYDGVLELDGGVGYDGVGGDEGVLELDGGVGYEGVVELFGGDGGVLEPFGGDEGVLELDGGAEPLGGDEGVVVGPCGGAWYDGVLALDGGVG